MVAGMPGPDNNTPAEPHDPNIESVDVIVIDLQDTADRWRYTCPNGHRNWDRTNNHVWCQTCRRQYEAGEGNDPEHYELLDQKTGETVPWSRIRVAGDGSWGSHAVGSGD